MADKLQSVAIECELCKNIVLGLHQFVGHPCINDEVSQGDETATSQSTIHVAQPSTSVEAATCTSPVFWNEKATKMHIAEMKIIKQSGENSSWILQER